MPCPFQTAWQCLVLCAGTAGLALPAAHAFELSSPAFANGGAIPAVYTCDGANRSPPLTWTGIPAQTVTLLLTMEDPDAPTGTWDHWIVFNIPVGTTQFAAGARLPAPIRLGNNSWQRATYGGPCPPDREHRYRFTLWALDMQFILPPGTPRATLQSRVQGHVLAQAQYTGRYRRKPGHRK